MKQYQGTIARFRQKQILVIGDIMLDQYIFGNVSRISPEAPVPIVLQEGSQTYTPGGSANVAANLRTLGAKVTLIGRIGADKEGQILLRELKKRKIDTQSIALDRTCPTSLKTRIVASHQQVLRLDRELTENCPLQLEDKIKRFVQSNLKKYDAVIISDYGKGLISSGLVEDICSQALSRRKIITVDPKVEHFSFYRGVTAITPNRKEAENAIRDIKIKYVSGRRLPLHRDQLQTDADIDEAGKALLNYLNLESLLITLGEQGMRLFERGKKPIHINTKAQEVFDVTGAGDTVIAVFTLALTAGADKHQAADIANYAAGIVVGHRGAVAISPKELTEVIP